MTPFAGRGFPRRELLLFVMAIGLPCTVLVLLTVRMLVQERELAGRRVADERRRLTVDVRQALLSSAEQLRGAASGGQLSEAGIVTTAPIVDGRLVLPWALPGAPPLSGNGAFRTLIGSGERLEFADSRFDQAAAAYARAAAAAQSPAERAASSFLMARALAGAGRIAEAERAARGIFQQPVDALDDQGIPYWLYAARLSLRHGGALRQLVPPAIARLARVPTLPTAGPEMVFMAIDVAKELNAPASIIAGLSERVRDLEQVRQLRDDLPTLAVPPSTIAEPVWVSYGPPENRWLLHIAARAEATPTLTVLRASDVLSHAPHGATVLASRDGESLAPIFPDLSVSFAARTLDGLAADSRVRQPIYLAVLVLVVGLTMSGGYLFWRDVNREVRVAALRSQFVASVSHELKTPLTAIRMFAETLMMGHQSRPEVQHEYLETIVHETERLTRLLNNVLDFSKIESGTKTYYLAPVSLPSIVSAAARSMQYPFAQQGFELRVHIADDVGLAAADADAVQQVVLNLLSNALKYSGDGRQIDLSLTREQDHAVIAVTDRGIGIPVEEHKRIFEKFYRVGGEAGRVTGTGLGLTLVEHVARAHGGAVTVRSAPGEGSTFAVRLPLLPIERIADHVGAVA